MLDFSHTSAVHHRKQIVRPVFEGFALVTVAHHREMSQSLAGLHNFVRGKMPDEHNVCGISQPSMVYDGGYPANNAGFYQFVYYSQYIFTFQSLAAHNLARARTP